MASFDLPSVPKQKTDETLIYIYKNQKSFPISGFLQILIFFIIGIIIGYIGILLLVLSLFNPILLFITIGV
jgi:hypothetical protein